MSKHLAKLVVRDEPVEEFYKDEGGKSNWMRARLALVSGRSLVRRSSLLVLRAVLYYESGQVVEEADQKILRLKESAESALAVDPSTSECVAHFRIEKVSRRKDNQRFQVQFEVDPEHESVSAKVSSVRTRPIMVFSKRKIPAHIRNDPEAIAALKAQRASRKRQRNDANITTPEMKPGIASRKRARPEDDAKYRASINEGVISGMAEILKLLREQQRQIQRLQDTVDSLPQRCKTGGQMADFEGEGRCTPDQEHAKGEHGFSMYNPALTMSPSGSAFLRNDSWVKHLRNSPQRRELRFDFGLPSAPTSPSGMSPLNL